MAAKGYGGFLPMASTHGLCNPSQNDDFDSNSRLELGLRTYMEHE